jgi:hypothetical protein
VIQSGRHHLNDRAAANRALKKAIIIIITALYNQSQFPDMYWIFRMDWAILQLVFLAVVELLAIHK